MLALASCGDSRDKDPASGGLEVLHAYLRQPAPGQAMLAAYVTFNNTSNRAYKLNHIGSPRASSVEVHRTIYHNGVMSMRRVSHLVVPPQAKLVFKSGGYHLMLSGMERGVEGALKPGDQIPLSFSFAGGLTLEVMADVRAVH